MLSSGMQCYHLPVAPLVLVQTYDQKWKKCLYLEQKDAAGLAASIKDHTDMLLTTFLCTVLMHFT
jgi:hypothetical protein